MVRKYNSKVIDLRIEAIIPYENAVYTGFTIYWSSSIGFGSYNIYKHTNSLGWFADSEYMDSNDNKEFITELMRLFIETLKIEA